MFCLDHSTANFQTLNTGQMDRVRVTLPLGAALLNRKWHAFSSGWRSRGLCAPPAGVKPCGRVPERPCLQKRAMSLVCQLLSGPHTFCRNSILFPAVEENVVCSCASVGTNLSVTAQVTPVSVQPGSDCGSRVIQLLCAFQDVFMPRLSC